jgi:hypothetical protein
VDPAVHEIPRCLAIKGTGNLKKITEAAVQNQLNGGFC